jgi:predicted amidohydrolase
VWSRGAGDGLKVVDTELGKVGGLICWENYMPAARLAMYQQGIEYVSPFLLPSNTHPFPGIKCSRRSLTFGRIYIAPNADDLPAWIASMQHIAKEGRCFVISCNQFTRVSDFPGDFPPFLPDSADRQPDGSQWAPESILNHGGSCVVGPLGTMIAEPVWDKEGIVYAELGRAELMESRMDFDAVGSYARPDIL